MSIPVSGAISGLVASLIVSPYERIKILRQNQTKFNLSECTNPSFLFKGLSATFTREVPGFAIYFSTYEYLKNKFYTSQNKEIDIVSSFVFGGIAGSNAWLFIYPQDRIKTIIQSNDNNNKLDIKSICVEGDSLLVIKQMKGEYKVKSSNLINLYNEAKELEKQFEFILFSHIYRCQNKRADELSNLAISKDRLDEKMYYDEDDKDDPDEYLFKEEK
jgi:hypothetical protein